MGGSVHSDHHAIVSHPNFDGVTNRQVYYGNDGGIYRLNDSNGTSFTRLNNNYGVTQFYGGAGNVATGKIVGGTQDNGTLLYTPANGPQNWTSMHGSDGGFSAADQTDPNYFYGETQWLGVHRSSNGGASSARIDGCGKAAPYRLDDGCNLTTNFISPILLDPNQPNRLLAGGQRLWRTDDARTATTGTTGPAWAVIKTQTSGNSSISAIAVPSGDSDLVWIGHNNGDVYKTTSGTSPNPIWNLVDTGLPNRVATSIAITPSNNNIVYVSFGGFNSGNLWKTTDGGGGWANAGAGLPSVPVRSVVVHPTNQDWIYVGTDVGVFASENAGASWNVPHDGPANVAVFNLFWMNTTLVAVTHGRGMFTAAVAGTPPAPVITQHPAPRKIVVGSSTTFTAGATGAPTITWQWQVWNGVLWANVVDGAPYSGATTPTLTITNAPAGLTPSSTAPSRRIRGGSTSTAAALLTVYVAGANLLTNGDFAGGITGWLTFEAPDIVWNIVGGVMQFFRASSDDEPVGPGRRLSALRRGARRRHAARGVVRPGQQQRRAQAADRRHPRQQLQRPARLHVLPGAGRADADLPGQNALEPGVGERGDLLLLGVGRQQRRQLPGRQRHAPVRPGEFDVAHGLRRIQRPPLPPGGAASANLLTNGDFGTGALAPWGTFGAITWQITGGVFEFFKPASAPGTPAGVVLQGTGQPTPLNQIFTSTFQLGNSSAVRRRVTVLLHDGDFSDLAACTFWLTPSQTLSTYSIRMFTTEAWSNPTLSVYSATTGSHQWILFDNAAIHTTPGSVALGTECFEPSAPPPFQIGR